MKKIILFSLMIFSVIAHAYDPGAVSFKNLLDVQMNNWRMIPSVSSKQYGGKGAYVPSTNGPFWCFGSSVAGTDSTIRVGYLGQKSFVGTTPTNAEVRGTSYNSTSNTLFAFGTISGGAGFVLYGTDCVSWTTGTWSGTGYGRAGASNSTVNVIVGGVSGAGCSINYSAAGVTWTAATMTGTTCTGAGGGEFFDVIWNGTKFVATGFNKYATSTNGINWVVGALPTGSWTGLVWDGKRFITSKGTGDVQFATSTDGVTWTVLPGVYTIGNFTGNTFIWNGKYYFSSTLNLAGKRAAYSTDLYNWKTIDLPAGSLAGVGYDGIRIIGINSAPVTATDTFVLSNGLY